MNYITGQSPYSYSLESIISGSSVLLNGPQEAPKCKSCLVNGPYNLASSGHCGGLHCGYKE